MVNLKEVSEKVNIEVFPCPHCTGILGTTTPNIFYLGPAKITRTLTFNCGYCDKVVVWRPDKENFNKK